MNAKPHYRFPHLRLGLIGYPIAHSQSPELFQNYCPYDLIETPSFEAGFQQFLEGDYYAVNVTTPFKAEAYRHAQSADPVTGLLQVANLLVKEPEGVKAYNTDFLAVVQLLQEYLPLTPPQTILVLGYGGAGKAAAAAASHLGHRVWIANRTTQHIPPFPAELLSLSEAAQRYPLADCIIQALPTQAYTHPEVASIPQWKFSNQLILEANYAHPLLAHLATEAKENAPRYLGGRLWLSAQAQPLIDRILQENTVY